MLLLKQWAPHFLVATSYRRGMLLKPLSLLNLFLHLLLGLPTFLCYLQVNIRLNPRRHFFHGVNGNDAHTVT